MTGEMIADLTEAPFLSQLLTSVHSALAEAPDPADGAEADLSREEVVALVEETLEATYLRQRPTPSGVAKTPEGDEPLLPHSAVAALLQSTVEEYVDDRRSQLARSPTVASRSGGVPPIFTDRRLISTRRVRGSRVFGVFEPADLRWVASAFWHRLRQRSGKHPFKDAPAQARLAEKARVVLVGDWGSGIPRARLVAGQMRHYLEEAATEGIEAHAIHLGDVYYSGLPREYERRFLPHWPVRTGEHDVFTSWCLNANHDMYSGGYGYFDHLLADPRFTGHQASSWFTLGNDDWTVVGLDTAWDEEGLHDDRSERGLHGEQATVVNRLAAQSETRLVLLSHHPLFNGDRVDTYLRRKLAPALDAGAVYAWFWGHEHAAETYEAREGVAHPVCLGHGGVPKYALPWSRIGDGVLWRELGYREERLQRWALFGFAVLDFDGPRLKTRYFDERGRLSNEEDLS